MMRTCDEDTDPDYIHTVKKMMNDRATWLQVLGQD